MISDNAAREIVDGKILINLNNLVAWPARTGIQRVCYEFCSRWPYLEDTIPFVEVGLDKIGLLEPDFFKYLSIYFEREDEVLADLVENHGLAVPDLSLGWLGIISARNRIVCELSVDDALKYCRCVMSLEESLNMDFFSFAAKRRPEKIFNLCHDFLSWTHPEYFAIDWQTADNVSISIANRRKYPNNFFTSTAMREQYVSRINRGDTRNYAVIAPGADGFGRTFRKSVPDTTEFVVVGTLEPRKQPLQILDVFTKLQEQGVDARLCFAGRMGWLKPDDKDRLTQAFDTYPWLRWVDGPDDAQLRSLIASSRATIYLSVAEGYGSPPIESLALGVPCIVSSEIPSVADIAPNGQIRIHPHDSIALIEAIRRLLDDCEMLALQEEIENLALPTWQEFVDGIAALVNDKMPLAAAPIKGNILSYPDTLAIIQTLERLWELDSTTLIRNLLSILLPSYYVEENTYLWENKANEGKWSNVETVLEIIKEFPTIPPNLVKEAITGSLSIASIEDSFAREWIKEIDLFLAIDSEESFEESIYTVIHKRLPGPGECKRSYSLRSGKISRIDVLIESIESDEYRNRIMQSIKNRWAQSGFNFDEGQFTPTSLEWQLRLLQAYSLRSRVDRILRLPVGPEFLDSAFHDLLGAFQSKDMDRFKAILYGGKAGKEKVILTILLSEQCVRRMHNPIVHLNIIHSLAARVGSSVNMRTEPINLAIMINNILSLPRHELIKQSSVLLSIGGDSSKSAKFAEYLVKNCVDSKNKKSEVTTNLAAGLIFFGFLNGYIDKNNPVLAWSATQLANYCCIASFKDEKNDVFPKSIMTDTFTALLRRDPSAKELEVLDEWASCSSDKRLLLAAVRLFAFRQAEIDESSLRMVLDFALDFPLIRQHWSSLTQNVQGLELATTESRKAQISVCDDRARDEFIPRLEMPSAPTTAVYENTETTNVITSIYQLLALDGESFVSKVYEVLLQRESDPSGLKHYTNQLALGNSKHSVIYDIACSEEAKKKGVDLFGLDALIAKQWRKKNWFWKIFMLFTPRY